MHLSKVSAVLAAIALLTSTHARANGRYPLANQMVHTPGKPDELALRATFGLLLSPDRGQTWNWVCEQAMGYGGTWDPPIGVFGSGLMMAGTTNGLAASPDRGCGWAFANGPLGSLGIIDVVVRAETPSEGFALTSDGRSEDGGVAFSTELHMTTNDGKDWNLVTRDFDPAFIAQTLEVARSDPNRLYISGSVGAQGVVLVSTDRGVTFVVRPVPLEKPTEGHPFLSAVDPKNPDRVYVRTNGTTSRLLVSDDAGLSFRAVFTGPPLLGFALSPDGSRVWLGGVPGLFVASTSDFVFTQLNDSATHCLLATDELLYACVVDTRSTYALGASSDGGKTFGHVLGLGEVRGPVACASESAAKCEARWPALREELQGAVPDAGTDAGSPPPARAPKGGGCNIAGVGAGGSGLLVLMAAVALLRRRVRHYSRCR